jgi:iron complex transport system permease protein
MTAAITPHRDGFTIRLAILLGLGLAMAVCVGLAAGHDWASPARLLAALTGDRSLDSRLITDWRLPRVLAAALVGALLGIGGCLFQGLFRNPLAEPYLLGSAGGAAVGATVALLVPFGLSQALTLPVLAFCGAWSATIMVLLIGRVSGVVDAAGLLLAGVAVAAILGALRSFLMLALSDESVSLQVVLSWVLGGVQTPGPAGLAVLAVLTGACLLLALTTARGLDLLGLGEDMARSFGLDVKGFIAVTILVGSAVVAVAVAFGGLVAFIGLAAPHLGRSLVGPRHRPLILASALIGAIAVVLADALARAALPPAEIPLGLITALAGGPFFLVLLARRLRP